MVAYLFGAVFWIISLVFRVTLEVWAAREMAQSGVLPIGFEAWQQWAALLFAIYIGPAISPVFDHSPPAIPTHP